MKLLLLFFVIIPFTLNAQYLDTKEYDKALALIEAKAFIVDHILNSNDSTLKFQTKALAASSSRELTSIVYKCNNTKKMGLLLAFYNKKWNKFGTHYTRYSFKSFSKNEALSLFDKINSEIEMHEKYLQKDSERNIYFKYDDLRILICYEMGVMNMRVFWKEFDSEWQSVAFGRTLRRFERTTK